MRMNLGKRTHHQTGFTLVELMIVMVLLSLVVGGLVKVIAGQQRFYRSAGDLMESRSQIRQAISLLPADLRGVSTVGQDVITASDTSIRFRSTFGSSALCSVSGNTLRFPPATLASGQTISARRTLPSPGDRVALYDDGPTTGKTDDRWVLYTVTNVAEPIGACAAPFVAAADLVRASLSVTVAEAISPTLVQGAPARFLREVEYRLYTAGDGKPYLGYMECPGGACAAIQPVSGPYRRFVGTSNAANGLQFQYFDSLGTEIGTAALGTQANRNNIARIRITVRGETASAMAMPGLAAAPKRDALTIHVGVRNRQ